MKRAIAVLLVAVVLLISTEANAACYKFEWTGFVESIESMSGSPATLEGVDVDDWFMATVTYGTTAFGPGVYITSDVLDYPAPPGLEMTYQFESGFSFFKDISAVRVGKTLTNHQWNWIGGDFGGLLFQANDWTHSAFNLPLPVLFDEMHTLFLGTLSMFEPSSGNHLGVNMGDADPDNDRMVFFRDQAFSVTPCITEIEVAVDIKPGDYPNSINPNARGFIPVAILTIDDFDASTIDPETVALEGVYAREKGKSGRYGSLEDVDGDGDLDLVVQIKNVIDWEPDTKEATLTGLTWDGIPIIGTDSVNIVPPRQ